LWNRDESLLRLTYDDPDGSERTFTAELQDDLFRDKGGRVVGRALPGGSVVIDPAAISADLVDEDEPKLCPAPSLDKASGKERAKDYEDYVKSIVNPENPTPRGWGFQLQNPAAFGKLVFYDDCQHSTGKMVEAKGPGYAGLLTFERGEDSLREDFLNQAGRQVEAARVEFLPWPEEKR
jgi:hypothetical protein